MFLYRTALARSETTLDGYIIMPHYQNPSEKYQWDFYFQNIVVVHIIMPNVSNICTKNKSVYFMKISLN